MFNIFRMKGFKFLIWFVILTVVFAITFNYMGIELSNAIWVAILGFSLMIAGLISMYNRGIFHQGHFPILMGVVFIAVGGMMFYGTLAFSYTDDNGQIQHKEQLWDLTAQEGGIFILLVIVGIFSFVSGVKQSMGASYFWGQKRR